MRKLARALHSASVEAADSMTSKIRSAAISSGWDAEVANNLHLKFEDGKFTLTVPSEYKSRVHDHEFGTQSTPPNPVLRKILADPHLFDNHIGKVFNRKWAGK